MKEHSRRVPQPLHILVVEEEIGIRKLVTEFLLINGHTVRTANDGREGFERFKASGFDVVVTNGKMQYISGAELAIAIKRLAPQTPIIMMTGAILSASPKGVDAILDKPFTLQAFEETLAKVTITRNASNSGGVNTSS